MFRDASRATVFPRPGIDPADAAEPVDALRCAGGQPAGSAPGSCPAGAPRPVPAWHALSRRTVATAAFALLAVTTACGAPPGPPVLVPSRAWDASLVDLFDDAADWVAPLRTLVGTPWFEEYGARLEQRVAEADVVAVVRLKASIPPGGAQAAGALEMEVLQSLVGDAVPGMIVRLDVSPAAAERIDAEAARLEDQGRFVAFIRLYLGETGDVRNHWHLSPYDQDLVNTIRRTTMR